MIVEHTRKSERWYNWAWTQENRVVFQKFLTGMLFYAFRIRMFNMCS